jgi:osmoprotectant transport system permease protein
VNENFLARAQELPLNLSNHLEITVIALGAGVLISVPAAVLLARFESARYPVLTGAGVVQTIPSLALLALMVPILDRTAGLGLGLEAFGFWPAVIALTLYSVLPILRNSVTGLLGVDAAVIEAARGVGMNERQVLLKVQLPLAAPVIIAGIRTATVWVVGIATLATPVGQRCLGNYIFTGLQTRNWVMVMFGVVGAAALAIVLDAVIGGLQKALEERRRALGTSCAVLLAAILVAGLIAPDLVRWVQKPQAAPARTAATAAAPAQSAVERVLKIGTKTFTEQYVLAELIARRLEAAGVRTHRSESLGSTIVFDALVHGDVDLYVDYSGTIWANYMKREQAAAPWRVLEEARGWLAATHGVRLLGTLGFENAYALVMRRDHAERLGIETIDDLAREAGNLSIGGDYEFFGRPEWRALREHYGLRFAERTSYDSTLMYEAIAKGRVDVISAFSSDGRIRAYDLEVLADSRGVIPPYDAVLLLGPSVAGDARVTAALAVLLDAIDVAEIREANLMVDRDDDKKTVEQAAAWLDDRL